MPEDDDSLIAFARGYFANDFPNPTRSGCPGRAKLEELSASKRLPDAGLRAHLLGCSECFQFLNSRLAARPAKVGRRAWWEKFSGGVTAARLPLSVGALLVVSCFALWALWPRFISPTPEGAQTPSKSAGELAVNTGGNTAPPTTLATPTELAKGRATPAPPKGDPRRGDERSPALAARLVTIDLTSRLVLRGADDSAEDGRIRVSAARNKLAIRLPDGSPSGGYTVSLLDAFGETVMAGRGRSRDGKSVTLLLDMSSLPTRNYRLCVSHEGGAPSCLPISVTGRR
jgi:hypothetical protein